MLENNQFRGANTCDRLTGRGFEALQLVVCKCTPIKAGPQRRIVKQTGLCAACQEKNKDKWSGNKYEQRGLVFLKKKKKKLSVLLNGRYREVLVGGEVGHQWSVIESSEHVRESKTGIYGTMRYNTTESRQNCKQYKVTKNECKTSESGNKPMTGRRGRRQVPRRSCHHGNHEALILALKFCSCFSKM